MLIGVPWYEVDCHWHDLKPFVEKGLIPSGESVTAEDVREKCKEREFQLWILWTDHPAGAGVSYLAEEEGELVAWVYALGGKGVMSSIIDAMDQFKAWAKSMHAKKVRLRGRVGWTRIFPEWEVKDKFLELAL